MISSCIALKNKVIAAIFNSNFETLIQLKQKKLLRKRTATSSCGNGTLEILKVATRNRTLVINVL